MKTIAYTTEEGGLWTEFSPGLQNKNLLVHSIKFSDGSIWDVVNGWRDQRDQSWDEIAAVRPIEDKVS